MVYLMSFVVIFVFDFDTILIPKKNQYPFLPRLSLCFGHWSFVNDFIYLSILNLRCLPVFYIYRTYPLVQFMDPYVYCYFIDRLFYASDSNFIKCLGVFIPFRPLLKVILVYTFFFVGYR